MHVLTWNLFHGRAVPEQPRSLSGDFVAALRELEWSVALLQEAPPWWAGHLAAACGSDVRSVLTSRNWLPGWRRAIAGRRPDLLKSNGGGSNVILVRPPAGTITAHASKRLRLRPERRVLHAVRLGGGAFDGVWIGNVHAQVRPHELTRADLALAGGSLLRWSAGGPALLAGDLNVPDPQVDGFADAGGHHVDRFLVHGALSIPTIEVLERPGDLSDHKPVMAWVERSEL
ncbi:MAG: endonuclease/exonuclease/phosphatase family protein [Baekduia sp.]